MNTLIAFILILVAGAAWLKRPLNISLTIHHKYDVPPVPKQELEQQEEQKSDKEAVATMDNVIRAINEIMTGGDDNDTTTDRTNNISQ
jgi:hypothetical protein